MKYALPSEFSIKSIICGKDNNVNTSKEHRSGKRGPLSHDINSRAVLGSLHTGIGATHLDNLLSTLNVPPLNENSFENRERELGLAVEKLAKKRCKDSMLPVCERNAVLQKGENSDGCVSVSALLIWGGKRDAKATTQQLVRQQ